MPTLTARLTTIAALVGCAVKFAAAQTDEIVFGSVIVARNGERTPLLYENTDTVLELSSVGAQQMFAAGQAYRARYIESTTTHISGLSDGQIDQTQVYSTTVDDILYQFFPASAAAFMQGLYPPATLQDNAVPSTGDILANGTVVNTPLNGYQYAWVHAPSVEDPASIYIQGYAYCPTWQTFINGVGDTSAYQDIVSSTMPFYTSVGNEMADTFLTKESYQYSDAYVIWDYLSYMYNHNSEYQEQLTTGFLGSENAYQKLRYLANQHEWSLYGNITQFAAASNDQISLIGGQTMAALILGLLQENYDTLGVQKKLSVIVAEYPMFLSWFSLANLLSQGPSFAGIPDWASTMVFELYASSDATPATNGSSYPLQSELYVRFLFQNGTNGNGANDTNASLQAYPLFGQSAQGLKWTDFQTAISALMVNDISDWCSICSSWDYSVFCPAYNPNLQETSGGGNNNAATGLTPKTAGVIGAVATLAAVLFVMILLTVCGGMRFTRVHKNVDNTMGGFKGGQKLASDPDLTIIKGAGASVDPVSKERVSSWELKNNPPNLTIPQRLGPIGRLSMDDDDRIDPFSDPVKPDERV